MSADERARTAAEAMWKGDNASAWMGFELGDVSEGRASMSLTVQAHHANGHGTCHGGVTFALADSAFAFACNSRNQVTVAQHNSITYLAPGRVGDHLTAEASERNLTGRSGIYDVVVRNQDGIVIAEFRGLSRSIGGTLFDEAPTE
ncbi:MAG: phenylacetic acid degradation protein PaaD [Hyphomicrobiales bacterium]|nr:MAG: phenylacetic acid degradation protein PaaD [Hyphomicrobiales bacterium]